MKLIARKAFTFRGRALQPGDQFEAGVAHAIVFRKQKKADVAPKEQPPGRTLSHSDQAIDRMKADLDAHGTAAVPAPVSQPEPEPSAPTRRRYRRRDLAAED